MSVKRDELLRALAGAMEAMDAALALWEDGAAAFGRVDAFSDIDLAVLVKPGKVDEVAKGARSALSAAGGVIREYRQTTYHGDAQFFWQVEGVSAFNFIDISLIERKPEPYQIDRGTHGDPIVHFDKCGCLAIVEEDLAERRARIREGVERIAAAADLQPLLVRKYILRNEPLHAFGMYQRWMIQPLIELLRLKHCPERSSFQTTYLMWDLPAEVTEQLGPLMMVSGMEEIERGVPIAGRWIRALINEWRAIDTSS